jgi:hypothetical protein
MAVLLQHILQAASSLYAVQDLQEAILQALST